MGTHNAPLTGHLRVVRSLTGRLDTSAYRTRASRAASHQHRHSSRSRRRRRSSSSSRSGGCRSTRVARSSQPCPPARCFRLVVPAHTLDGGEIETDRLYISRRDIPI